VVEVRPKSLLERKSLSIIELARRFTNTEEAIIFQIDNIDDQIKVIKKNVLGSSISALVFGFLALFLFNYIGIYGIVLFFIVFLLAITAFGSFITFLENISNEGKLEKEKEKLIKSLKSFGVEYVPREQRIKHIEQLKAEAEKPKPAEQPSIAQTPIKITLNNETEGFFD